MIMLCQLLESVLLVKKHAEENKYKTKIIQNINKYSQKYSTEHTVSSFVNQSR